MTKYRVAQNKFPNLFSSELRQILTKFDNFWQTDGQDDKNMRNTQTVIICKD